MQLNTYKIPACCRQLLCPTSIHQIQAYLKRYPHIEILGGGSNVILMDREYERILLLSENFSGFYINGTSILARAGTKLDELCLASASNGLAGLERLSGIPGTVGGAVLMNAGAFGDEICQVVDEVICISRSNGCIIRFSRTNLQAGYRYTVLQKGAHVIAFIRLTLNRGRPEELHEIRQHTLAHRAERYPLEPNAGSLFVRPSIGLPAGKMIEMLGLKGKRFGGAEISRLHAGFCIAHNGCTGDDIVELARIVQSIVEKEFGVVLQIEQRMIFNVY